jgi:hypothetical protein
MARILLVLVVFAVLYGCGQTSSLMEKQEKQAGVEQAARGELGPGKEQGTREVVGNKAISAIVGESVKTRSFDYRLLDYFVTNHYYYLENPSIDDAMEGYSQAGKFVVVNYSVTNTSPHTVRPNLGAMLHAEAGSKTEVYEESRDVMHPKSGFGILELAPGEMGTGQFIFDVPTDVDPEWVKVLFENGPEQSGGEAGVVDLARRDPLGLRAEEVLALQYEYLNMTAWKQAYELFAEESKREVSLEQYETYLESGRRERPIAVIDYAFPSVEVEGDHATIERVFTLSTPDGENQHKATQVAVLEDEGWRIVMRDDQIRALLQRGTTVHYPPEVNSESSRATSKPPSRH